MADLIGLLRGLRRDERGEAAIYSMVFTVTAAVVVGMVVFATGLDNSFQSVGHLIGSVRAGL